MTCASELGSAGICVEDPRSTWGTHQLIQEVLTETLPGLYG